ncbi:MAG: tetratricopeptide repeat protein [Desulfobacterales bacterium]|nr:MAG: tetratricopeptide repeat protein [Desulfobacterales bacterium]
MARSFQTRHITVSRKKIKRDRQKKPMSSERRFLSTIRSGKADKLFKAGLRHHRAGRMKEAETLYSGVLQIHPDHFKALHRLGLLYCETGRFSTGMHLMKKAIAINANVPELYNDLGQALHDLARPEEAIACYEHAIKLNPRFAKAYNNLGNAFHDLEKHGEAMACLRQAIELKPDDADANNNLGIALSELDKPQEAAAYFEKATTLKPDFAEAHNNLGNALAQLGKIEEAITSYKRAAELKPSFPDAHGNLAYLLESTNQIDQAAKSAGTALELDPHAATAHLITAKCERRDGNFEGALRRLEAIDAKAVNAMVRAELLSEKGRLYDRLGSADKAFECFCEANAVTSQTWLARQINRDAYVEQVSRLRSWFLNTPIDTWSPSPRMPRNDYPAFLVGFPRSGTTLLQQILGTSRGLVILEEKPLVDSMIDHLGAHRFRDPEDIPRIDTTVIKDLRNAYLSKASEYVHGQHNALLVDKMPLNMVHVALIHQVFPGARIILALRHPCDVCLSCFMQNFRLNEAMIHFLDLNNTANLYNLVMELWSVYEARLPLNLYVIKYEDLVNEFDKETRRLFEFLELPWDTSVRDFAARAKAQDVKSLTPSYDQVSEPIYNRSIDRWKRYARHIEPIVDIMKIHVKALGYDLSLELQQRAHSL